MKKKVAVVMNEVRIWRRGGVKCGVVLGGGALMQCNLNDEEEERKGGGDEGEGRR